ncbi:MAG: glycosyltransferase [Microthrixaceae bacterium]
MTRRLLVIGAGAPWDGTRLADRHLAEALAGRFEVLYVDPARSFRDSRNDERLSKVPGARVQRLRDGLWRLTPRVTPRSWYPGLRYGNEFSVRRALRRTVAQIGLPVAAVLSVKDVLLGVLDGTQAFWARDDYSAAASLTGISKATLSRMQQRAAERADLAIGVTPALCEKWEQLGVPARLIPNGVDPDLFARPSERPADIPDETPLVGFAGTISARIDLGLLHSIVDRGLSLMLVGFPQRTMPQEEIHRLVERDGVHWLGHRTYEDLPAYLQAMDVGLVPYTDSAFNRASFPLKTLEYLASGVPVVATDLPAIGQLGTDLISTADAGTFADVVAQQVPLRHDPALVDQRQNLARTHSWVSRASDIAAALGL